MVRHSGGLQSFHRAADIRAPDILLGIWRFAFGRQVSAWRLHHAEKFKALRGERYFFAVAMQKAALSVLKQDIADSCGADTRCVTEFAVGRTRSIGGSLRDLLKHSACKKESNTDMV